VFRLRSVNNITKAAANTGKAKITKIAVKQILHTNKGIWFNCIPAARIPATVTNKLMLPKILLKPFKCKLKIAKSTAAPLCCTLNGGYAVQPKPAPCSTKVLNNNKAKDGGFNQKLILFKRGNATSGAPIITGTNQLPNPPNKAGITMKSNIINPCPVIITLYNCPLPWSKPCPARPSSKRINIDKQVPISPANKAKARYIKPITR
jgi:hypothetical protein